MTKSTSKYVVVGILLILNVLLYWFWAFPFRSVLGYREEMQLFQTVAAYFASLAARPGGISTYVGEFLTQFFNNYWIGAAVMTVLMMLFAAGCFLVLRKLRRDAGVGLCSALVLIPLTALWLFMGNQNVTVAFVVALAITLWATVLFLSCIDGSRRCFGGSRCGVAATVVALLLTALLYYVAGPVAIVFPVLIIARGVMLPGKSEPQERRVGSSLVWIGCGAVVWLAANVAVWSLWLPYPLSYQLIGIGYVLNPDKLLLGQVLVEAIIVIIPFLLYLLVRIPRKVLIPALVVADVAAAAFLFPKAYDAATYRFIDYDYMVRANDWDGIIEYSDRHAPDLPLTVSAANLALGMTGQLDARAFDYFQHGAEGLVPPFLKETLSSWTTGEILFQLGLVNSAQRFYFEGMEAIPNYNKSARAVKRLAETAMIRGEYALAGKYLKLLENTLFYKKWAGRNLELIKQPEAIDAHPLYGAMRRSMIDETYMFSEGELDKTFGQLFLKNPGNTLARQYLVVYPLLQRDLNKFSQYMGVVAEKYPQYNPLLAQQALAFMSMKSGQPMPQGMVSPAVEQSLRAFAQAWTSRNPDLIAAHRNSLFHYLLSEQ